MGTKDSGVTSKDIEQLIQVVKPGYKARPQPTPFIDTLARSPDSTPFSDLKVDLDAALAQLAPDVAQAIRCHLFEGETQRAAAKRFGVRIPRFRAGLAAIQERLKDYGDY